MKTFIYVDKWDGEKRVLELGDVLDFVETHTDSYTLSLMAFLSEDETITEAIEKRLKRLADVEG